MTDHLDALAKELTDGTKIPEAFARETLKVCALSALGQRTKPPLVWNGQLHTRQYLILISDTPGAGKGESFRRVRRTVERSTDTNRNGNWNLQFIRGDSLGSPQYACTEFGGELEKPGRTNVTLGSAIPVEIDRRSVGRIVHYDEGRTLAEKDAMGGTGRGLVTMFTALYEDNALATGSFKNGRAKVDQADVSLILHFTRAGFDSTFTGSGTTTGGFLSRCTLIECRAIPYTALWRAVDSGRVRELVNKILADCNRRELLVEEGAEKIRADVASKLQYADPIKASRLYPLFVQDAYARAVFSDEGRLTKEIAEAASAWTMAQLKAREESWPLDQSPDKYERMHLALRDAFERSRLLSLVEMKRAVHLHRPGSGGIGVFMNILRQMVSGEEIRPAGANRRGTPMFEWMAE